jgi:Mn2+/Fe2+ NRAMP family transporter
MSQQKVDQKKLDKKNRRSTLRKKKLEEVLSLVVVAIIGLAIVVWVGFSVYTKIQQSAAENATYEYYDIDTAAIQDYLSTLD